jgi:hypothetical protein
MSPKGRPEGESAPKRVITATTGKPSRRTLMSSRNGTPIAPRNQSSSASCAISKNRG